MQNTSCRFLFYLITFITFKITDSKRWLVKLLFILVLNDHCWKFYFLGLFYYLKKLKWSLLFPFRTIKFKVIMFVSEVKKSGLPDLEYCKHIFQKPICKYLLMIIFLVFFLWRLQSWHQIYNRLFLWQPCLKSCHFFSSRTSFPQTRRK